MGENKKIMFIGIILFSLGLVSFYLNQTTSIKDLGVEPDNHLLLFFQESYPDKKVITCGYEDLNGDGRKDLLVIYNASYRKNEMVIVLDNIDGYKTTDPTPAPIDNQEIEFKDIDKTPPMEFIVSGSKDGNFGYAIFRLVDDVEIRDLFGDGMDDCC